MPNSVTRFLKFIRDLPGRASPKWPWPLRKVRKADISASDRDFFERYGETVISMKVSGSLDQDEGHARAWLTERADYHERREQWISARDLILDLVIIGLIGWEINMSYRQERHQSQDFEKQQKALTNLQNSSAATSDSLHKLVAAQDASLKILQQEQAERAKKPRLALYAGNTPLDRATVRPRASRALPRPWLLSICC